MNLSNVYTLQVQCADSGDTKKVIELLTLRKYSDKIKKWKSLIQLIDAVIRFEVVENQQDEYFDFINNFLDLLEGKYHLLEEMGIRRNDITFWYYGEYDHQCNMEFSPERLKRLGDNSITLCLSVGMDYS